MKLSRTRLLLLVALLALGGLLAVVWEPLWLALAYERVGTPSRMPVPIVLEKRWEWLPGEHFAAPPQECLSCYYASRPDAFQRYLQAVGKSNDSLFGPYLARHEDCDSSQATRKRRMLGKMPTERFAWAYGELSKQLPKPASRWLFSTGVPCTCPVCNHEEAK